MSRNAIAQILLAASISFTACGGGSKSSDKTTTPSAQNEQAPIPGEAVPSQTTAGTTGTPTGNTEAVPGVTTGEPSSAQTPSSDRQPVSGTTNDTSGMGTPGSTSGTTSGTTGSMSGTSGTMGGATTGTPGSTSGATTGTPGSTSGASGATGDTSGTSGTSGTSAGAAMTEATIFGALGAANQHEIEVSQLAIEKAKNKDVKKFAKMMVDHHKQLQATSDKTAKQLSITPEDNADVTALKDESRTAVEKLRGLQGAEFDKAYMDQMVQDHEKVLTLIDNQIMPAAASNDQIQSMLKTARPKIEAHLAQARKLQAKVGGGSSSMK